jgi:alkylation response protein AidB-like acyl-CoA dehydrogenase
MGEVTSILTLYGATLTRDSAEFHTQMMGVQASCWEGLGFSAAELEATRSFLSARGMTIFGGTNDVPRSIMAKRLLGLPD